VSLLARTRRDSEASHTGNLALAREGLATKKTLPALNHHEESEQGLSHYKLCCRRTA